MLPRADAVPVYLEEQATVPGRGGIRYFADSEPTALVAVAKVAMANEQAAWVASGHEGPLPAANFLAISGGGENGAYGAGLLVGWTKAGTRPSFKVVTGISTGALTAPFAFLGPSYDDRLTEVYTQISRADIFEKRGLVTGVLQDGMADSAPLRRTVARYFDQPMMDAIAAEYRKGRLLLIGTTNLDAHRPVIWNIGEIASRGTPGGLKLVQDILVASAAIPGLFPPMMIDVEVNGKHYQEMHVDGGASAQVFIYPPSLSVRAVDERAGTERARHLYVLRNARLDPEWAQVDRRTLTIASRAIASLIQTQGLGDLYRIYLISRRDNIDFNLAYIPRSFTQELNEPFETAYMNALYRFGYEQAAKGYPWEKAPRNFEDWDRAFELPPASGSTNAEDSEGAHGS
ncbi:MAG: patatin-like phospholipase family protein [Dongiaceae bacterium]